MAIGFSLLSVQYYIDGLDKGISVVMRDLAKSVDVEEGQPKNVAGFDVSNRWQDTPDIIQQRFISPPTDPGQLHKIKEQSSIFSVPENIYFVVLFYSPQGEKRFVSRAFLEKERPVTVDSSAPAKRLYLIFFTAVAAIVLFTFFLVMIMKKIAKPIESLKAWAKSLNENNLQKSPPDFIYNELNVLASLVQSSLISAHQSLGREQRFLSYASHELRTPIAVIRSNVDLLQRLSEQTPLSEKQLLTLQRIQRAGLTMSNLTDTLLWLSRNDEQEVSQEPINLHDKIKQLCADLDYLLNAKEVEVNIESEDFEVKVATTSCHIVLSNLIRNAYQHTQHGQVFIKQQGSRVTIINCNDSVDITMPISDTNVKQAAFGCGYGLGLQLSEKIIKRHGWTYEIADNQGRYQVTVDFGRDNS
jgi:signal transduction histidine kinase